MKGLVSVLLLHKRDFMAKDEVSNKWCEFSVNTRPAFGHPRPKVTMIVRANMMQKVWYIFPNQICPK